MDYWHAGSDARIFVIRGEYLYALNAKTGKLYPDFGDKGRTSLHFDEGQPLAGRFNDSTGPLVVGDVVVVTGNTAGAGDGGDKKEAAPEDVRGFSARTGKLLWTFTSCRTRASSASRRGATNRGRWPAISARGIR